MKLVCFFLKAVVINAASIQGQSRTDGYKRPSRDYLEYSFKKAEKAAVGYEQEASKTNVSVPSTFLLPSKEPEVPTRYLLPPKEPKYSSRKDKPSEKGEESEVKPSDKFTKLIFEDTFEELDFDKWRPEITAGGSGNWEFQYYDNTRHTSFIKNDMLHLKAAFTSEIRDNGDFKKIMKQGYTLDLHGNSPGQQCTAEGFWGCKRETQADSIANPMVGAQLRSVNSFNFKYGQVKIRAKMPKGDWLWPAIWLMPTHHAYGGWPASGEIDFIESRGNAGDCYGNGVSTVFSTLHWGVDPNQNKYELSTGNYTLENGKSFNDDFHDYTLEWTDQHIRTWVDDKLMLNEEFKESRFEHGNFTGEFNPWQGRKGNNAPFDQKFYLIFNLAVGGTNGYFSEKMDTTKRPENENDLSRWERCKINPPQYKKPWNNGYQNATRTFLMERDIWYKTWNSTTDQSHLIIDSVQVYSD